MNYRNAPRIYSGYATAACNTHKWSWVFIGRRWEVNKNTTACMWHSTGQGLALPHVWWNVNQTGVRDGKRDEERSVQREWRASEDERVAMLMSLTEEEEEEERHRGWKMKIYTELNALLTSLTGGWEKVGVGSNAKEEKRGSRHGLKEDWLIQHGEGEDVDPDTKSLHYPFEEGPASSAVCLMRIMKLSGRLNSWKTHQI